MPDATLARLGHLIEPKVIEQLHGRVVELAPSGEAPSIPTPNASEVG